MANILSLQCAINNSLHVLWDFHDAYPETYEIEFMKEYRSKTQKGRELEHARRRLEAWYTKLVRLLSLLPF